MPSSALRRSLALTLLTVLAAPLAGQSVKVSGSLALSPGTLGGDVHKAASTPDGSRILYLADQEAVGHVELYSVPTNGSGSAVRLSDVAMLHPLVDLDHFLIAPDGEHVVFGGQEFACLFSAPVDGSGPAVQLAETQFGYGITADSTRVVFRDPDFGIRVAAIDGSGTATTLVPEPGLPHDLGHFETSPDSSRLVYEFKTCAAPLICSGPVELYSKLLDGSHAAVHLNVPGTTVKSTISGQDSFEIAPDSSRVVFASSLEGSGPVELFSRPIDASAPPVVLSVPLGSAGRVRFFEIDPTGQIVVHTLVQGTGAPTELFSAPIDGSASAVQLNGPLVSGGSLLASGSGIAPFQITPDGVRVAYRADQLTDDVIELFQVPILGGTSSRVSRPLVAGGDVEDFQVSPDSIGVLYRADGDTVNKIELYGAAYAGGSLKYNPTPDANGDVQRFQISPNDARVVYDAFSFGAANIVEIYSVPIAGGTNTKLNGTLVSGGDASVAFVTPDSTRVVYLADQDTDELDELFIVSIAGGPVRQVNPELDPGPPSGDVHSFDVMPDSSSAVYCADGEEDDVFHLYRTSSSGVAQLSLSSPAGTGIAAHLDHRVTSDGLYVVYLQDPDFDFNTEYELFSVRVDGSQPPVRLSQPLVPIGQPGLHHVENFELSAEGTAVAYGVVFNDDATHIFTVNVDGSSPAPVKLNGTGGPPEMATEIGISPDGTRVVYQLGSNLYSAPFDGSQPAVQLNGALGPGGSVGTIGGTEPFQISSDSSRVVYVADATVDGRFELYSVPIAGGAAPRRLNANLPPGGDIAEFQITPNGLRVVYYGDQDVNDRYELYSVPIHGARMARIDRDVPGPERVKLNGPLASGGDVGEGCCAISAFVISPDGSRVAYTATPVDANLHELFSATIDGSQPPVQLTFGETSVSGPRFSPDGQRIVYDDTNARLRSIHVDGLQPSVQLSTGVVDLISGSFELPVAISPDGKWVVYRTDDLTAEVFELFARPIDGSQSPIELSAPELDGDVGGPDGNSVAPVFRITADNTHVLYGADQDFDGVFELYSTPLPSLP